MNAPSISQLEANRRNAQLSTGPKTPEGKAASSRNALKTGLTGRTVVLPSEDAAVYERHTEAVFEEFKPAGDRETELTQSVADSRWRLARIPGLESAIYALGRMKFAEEFQAVPAAEAALLIEAQTFLTFQRQLNNLTIQESRLRRQCEKDIAELRRIQEIRIVIAARKTKAAAAAANASPNQDQPARTAIGFEFSNRKIDAAAASETCSSADLTRPQAA